MKYNGILVTLGLLLCQNPGISAAEAEAPELKQEAERKEGAALAGVQKISDDVYVGKVNDQFYLAMERVSPKNVDMWIDYATQQIEASDRILKYLSNVDGSSHFRRVLTDYKSGKINQADNELWVAYASRVPVTGKAQLAAENPDIEMFVTVITSPKALITSHMGISRTREAALDLESKPPKRMKHPDQSVHLHSFAAKVMKKLDPDKVYMLTSPAIAMREIIIKKMPAGTVFVGDSIYKNELEAAEKDPKSVLTVYDLEEDEDETAQEREKRLSKKIKDLYDLYKIKEKLLLLKTNPPRIIRVQDGGKEQFTIQKPGGAPLVTFDQSTDIYQWMFTGAYWSKGLKLPYVLVGLDALAAATALIPAEPEEVPELKQEAERKEGAAGANVKKISNGLYVGKVNDNFYLAMERVNPENIGMWLKYAQHEEASGGMLPSKNGVNSFYKVLEYYYNGRIKKNNELWIAYASRVPVTKKAELKVPSDEQVERDSTIFTNRNYTNPDIEMFMTVITSPDALITSHMGISRTWEADYDLQRKSPRRMKHPDQSMHLHSFAAKVMKLKAPDKVYMLTAPAIAMREIILKKMPARSVFIGDNLYQAKIEAAEKDPKSRLDPKIKEKFNRLKTNPPRIIRVPIAPDAEMTIKTVFGPEIVKPDKAGFSIQRPDGTPLVTFEQHTDEDYQWMFTAPYVDQGINLPYVLVDLDALAAATALVPMAGKK